MKQKRTALTLIGFKVGLNFSGHGVSKKPLVRANVKDKKFNLKKKELVTILEENYKDTLLLITGRNYISVDEQDIIFRVLRKIFAKIEVQDKEHPLLNPQNSPFSGETLTWKGSVYDLLKTTCSNKSDSITEYKKAINSLLILGHTQFYYEVKAKSVKDKGFIVENALRFVKHPKSNKVEISFNKYFLQVFLQYSKLINPERYEELKGKYAKLLYVYLPFYADYRQVDYTLTFDELKAYLDPDNEYSNERILAHRIREAFQELQEGKILESVGFDKAGDYNFNTVTFKYSKGYRAEMANWVRKQKELLQRIQQNATKHLQIPSTGKEDDAEFQRMKNEFGKGKDWLKEQDAKLVRDLGGEPTDTSEEESGKEA